MFVEKRAQLAIVRPEIMAPFADAMRLIDRDQRELDAVDQPPEAVECRALRSDIEEVELTAPEAVDCPLAIASADVSDAARMPIASALRIWSCISAISGEMTSAVPGRTSAGNW